MKLVGYFICRTRKEATAVFLTMFIPSKRDSRNRMMRTFGSFSGRGEALRDLNQAESTLVVLLCLHYFALSGSKDKRSSGE